MSDFTSEQAASRWLNVNMPNEVRRALLHFASANPSYRGAEWWDVLSVLRDSDANLDVIEPLAEHFGAEWSTLHNFVTLTLIYADMHFARLQTTNMRAITVRATIAQGKTPDTSLSLEERLHKLLSDATALTQEVRAMAESRGEWVDWTAHKWLSDSLYDLHAAWSTVAMDNERKAKS